MKHLVPDKITPKWVGQMYNILFSRHGLEVDKTWRVIQK
jgi:hypothetical protein